MKKGTKISDATAITSNGVLCADWKSVETEKPDYYALKLCISNNNSIAVCWRASDGEEDIYTIGGTDNILINVTHWMDLPAFPICT